MDAGRGTRRRGQPVQRQIGVLRAQPPLRSSAVQPSAGWREGVWKVAPRADLELAVDVAEVDLDRLWGHVQRRRPVVGRSILDPSPHRGELRAMGELRLSPGHPGAELVAGLRARRPVWHTLPRLEPAAARQDHRQGCRRAEPGNPACSGQPRCPLHRCGRVHLRPARSRSCCGRSELRPGRGPRHCPRARHPCCLAQRFRRAVAGRRAHRASLRSRHDRAHQHSAPVGRRFGDARSRPGTVVCHPDRGKCRQTISISTSSPDFWDSIAVLFAPDGTPVIGSDDDNDYHVAFDWEAVATGTYVLYASSFESVSTGELVVERS